MKFSLDNITLVGQYETSLIDLLGVLPIVKNIWTTANQRYHYNMKLEGGGFLQLGHQLDKNVGMRLEFNPNKYKNSGNSYSVYGGAKNYEKDLYKILSHCSDLEFSRRDIALDVYGENMNDFSFIDYAGRKRIEYKTASYELETLYLGAPDSDERIRIYDKAKEQGIKDKKWFRIEAQVRREKARAMPYNPFTKIKVTKKNDFEGYDIRTKAMLFYLQANDDGWQELSKPARLKYKNILKEQNEETILNVEKMFNQAWEELAQDAYSWLNFADRETKGGTVIKIGKTVLADSESDLSEDELEALREDREDWFSEEFKNNEH
jgi:hypothetical protein